MSKKKTETKPKAGAAVAAAGELPAGAVETVELVGAPSIIGAMLASHAGFYQSGPDDSFEPGSFLAVRGGGVFIKHAFAWERLGDAGDDLGAAVTAAWIEAASAAAASSPAMFRSERALDPASYADGADASRGDDSALEQSLESAASD